jgi:hypothetical protein
MSRSIWVAMAEDRGRGAHTLADQPTKYKWAMGARGPSPTRKLDMATHHAANLIVGGAEPARAANTAIHLHELRFRESGHAATVLVRMIADATVLADAKRRPPRPERKLSDFQIPLRIMRQAVRARAVAWASARPR